MLRALFGLVVVPALIEADGSKFVVHIRPFPNSLIMRYIKVPVSFIQLQLTLSKSLICFVTKIPCKCLQILKFLYNLWQFFNAISR